MQIANVKLRQILPRMGKIWVSTPQNTHLPVLEGKTLQKSRSSITEIVQTLVDYSKTYN